MHTVGKVAELAGVTVRTLHHYDEIGLLRPSGRSTAGYRLYDTADLDRLFAILAYRELGFSLDEITALLSEERPTAELLREQHKLLSAEVARLQRMLAVIDTTLEAEEMGSALTPEEKLELFGPEWTEHEREYAAEAEERWGDTDEWQESQRRMRRLTKQDWLEINAENAELGARIKEAVSVSVAPDSEAGKAIAEQHRQNIDRWFYNVSYEIHRGLGQMYVDDPRFRAFYENIVPGGAAWMRDAIEANAADHE